MKKIVSISLLLAILISGINVKIASHYCGGNFAGIKVSLDGELASCGMEESNSKLPPAGHYFAKHCCDDVVTTCRTDSNYTPSFSFLPESFHYNFQVLTSILIISDNSSSDIIPSHTSFTPPGALMSTDVHLSDICVFRI